MLKLLLYLSRSRSRARARTHRRETVSITTVWLCHKKGVTDTVGEVTSDERRQAPHRDTQEGSLVLGTLIKSCASAHGPARVAASATYVRISLLKEVGRDGSKRQRVAPQGGGAEWGGDEFGV